MRISVSAEVIRFVIVGIIATFIHYGIYWLLIPYCNATLAYSAGYLVSLVCNFILTSCFTFREKASIRNGLGFGLSHLVNYMLHTGLLNLYLWIGLKPLLAPVFVFPIVVPINFFLLRFVFKH